MNISTRHYNQYHRVIWQMVQESLDQRKLVFRFVNFAPGMQGELPDTPCALTVIWSEDHLGWRQRERDRYSSILRGLADQYQHILLLTAVDSHDLDFDLSNTNVTFLHYGGDIMFQSEQYPKVRPQREKNLNPNYHWISLSHDPRPHRILAACCLLGHGLGDQTVNQNHGLLRISNYSIKDFQTWQQYLRSDQFDPGPTSPEQDRLLQYGFDRLLDLRNGGQPDCSIYDGAIGLDNAGNFDKKLRLLYENTLVEIVNETVFFQHGIFVTEKFQNSVYAFNLPIILAAPGTVDYLRSHGFDMFDDVVNHEYDRICDPLQRIFQAVESNFRLLTDPDHARECWQHCLPRLENNYQYARSKMYQHFQNKFRLDLELYLDTIQKKS